MIMQLTNSHNARRESASVSEIMAKIREERSRKALKAAAAARATHLLTADQLVYKLSCSSNGIC